MHHTRSHANGNLSSRANAFSVESLISPENTNQELLSSRMAASTDRGSPDNTEQGKLPTRQSCGRTHSYFNSSANFAVSTLSVFRSGHRGSRLYASHAKSGWICRNIGMRRHYYRTANERFMAAILWVGHRNDNYQSRQVGEVTRAFKLLLVSLGGRLKKKSCSFRTVAAWLHLTVFWGDLLILTL